MNNYCRILVAILGVVLLGACGSPSPEPSSDPEGRQVQIAQETMNFEPETEARQSQTVQEATNFEPVAQARQTQTTQETMNFFGPECFDLETGDVVQPDRTFLSCEGSDWGFFLSYNSLYDPHAVVVQNRARGVGIAYSPEPYRDVDAADVAELSFATDYVDVPFDRVAVLRTASGSAFKIGPIGEGPCTTDENCAVTFQWEDITPESVEAPSTPLPTPTPDLPPDGFARYQNRNGLYYSIIYPSDWTGGGQVVDTQFASDRNTTCLTVGVSNLPIGARFVYGPPGDVQICYKRLSDGLSLDEFMRQPYTDKGSGNFHVVDLNGIRAFRMDRAFLTTVIFLQTRDYRAEIVAGAATFPEKGGAHDGNALAAQRHSQVQAVIDSFRLVGPPQSHTPPNPSRPTPTPRTSEVSLTVTNTNDSGLGSLRQAIMAANAKVGGDTIEFDIPGVGPHRIRPQSALPTITDPVTIDGSAEFTGTPDVELDGTGAGIGASGLQLTAGSSVVSGLVINRFHGNGILIETSGGNVIMGNYIGTDITGTIDMGNSEFGILIRGGAQDNTIGGATYNEANIISGNDVAGVGISGHGTDSNALVGNYIGTDFTGMVALGNAVGVQIAGGAQFNTVGRLTNHKKNVISGNDDVGVLITDPGTDHNVVLGNHIGLDILGTAGLGNSAAGILIGNGAQCNTVGGKTSGSRNIVSGNDGPGVHLSGTNSNTVSGNYIGTDFTGTFDLVNGGDGIFIESVTGDSISSNAICGNFGPRIAPVKT